uniref:Pseudouridine-5'-phosphatase n=1 Tax=Megaselia scalaris TaxID=36166 RepID=T1GL88_MEGSC
MENCDLNYANSEQIYDQIDKELVEQFNVSFTDEVRFKIKGLTDQKSAAVIVNELKLPISVDEYVRESHRKCRQLLGDTDLMPGAEKLLRHLEKHNIPMAVATSSPRDMVAIKTKKHQEIFKVFHHIVCGSGDPEVKDGKPCPDIFLVAAKRFDESPNPGKSAKRFDVSPTPEKCLVFEDAPNGVTAANSAGMQNILVPDPHVPKAQTLHATIVLRSLEDFKPESFGLPAFD